MTHPTNKPQGDTMTTQPIHVTARTTYVTIAVHIEDDTATIDLSDDGDPGIWGNTFVYDGGDGEWIFDFDAQARAYDLVLAKLKETT